MKSFNELLEEAIAFHYQATEPDPQGQKTLERGHHQP